jgi:hypothetical protein
MKEFKLKSYDTIEGVLLASFQQEDESFTMEDLREGTIGGKDQNENDVEVSFEKQKEGIIKQGHWGWIDENNVIHYWIGHDLPLENLIHFFAHEIGHNTGIQDKDDFQEEMRAEGYGQTATLAYKFASEIKTQFESLARQQASPYILTGDELNRTEKIRKTGF